MKKPAFAKRVKVLEAEREEKFFKFSESGQQSLDLNFEGSEAESLDKLTEKGTQTDSRMFVYVGTQSEEFVCKQVFHLSSSTLLCKIKRLQYASMIQLARPYNLGNERIKLSPPFLLLSR